MFEPFLGRFGEIRVRVCKRGKRRRREGEENEKMSKSGFGPFYMCAGSGRPKTRSMFLQSWALDQDPDGSGSIQRSWNVGLIQTHQCPWVWALGQFLMFLCFFLLSAPVFLLIEPSACQNFTKKFQDFYRMCFTIFLTFCAISYVKIG